jgi:hypothetical protein
MGFGSNGILKDALEVRGVKVERADVPGGMIPTIIIFLLYF